MEQTFVPIGIVLTLAILGARSGTSGVPEAARRQHGFINSDNELRPYYQFYGDGGDELGLVDGGHRANSMGSDPTFCGLQPRIGSSCTISGGRSDRDPDAVARTIDTHVDDLEAVRQHLGMERMILIGYSWGRVLAAVYAENQPKHVERMILIGPMGPTRALFERRLVARQSYHPGCGRGN